MLAGLAYIQESMGMSKFGQDHQNLGGFDWQNSGICQPIGIQKSLYGNSRDIIQESARQSESGICAVYLKFRVKCITIGIRQAVYAIRNSVICACQAEFSNLCMSIGIQQSVHAKRNSAICACQ